MRVVEVGPYAIPVLTSEVIPPAFVHGFTTRGGGVSAGRFASLNLGARWGDDPAAVAQNRVRVAGTAGVAPDRLHIASQVHGAEVVRVEGGRTAAATERVEADGLFAVEAGVALAVTAADCVPMLLADPLTGACAAVHAGWRGTARGVAVAAVTALRRAGSAPGDLRAALGPAIGACCFEVGEEVVDALRAAFAGDWPRVEARVVRRVPGARTHVDLRAALAAMLVGVGLAEGAIDVEAACTRCDPAGRFFSHRGAGGPTGLHAGFIGRRPDGGGGISAAGSPAYEPFNVTP